MLSLRSLAFILYSAIRRARALSCAALQCFPDRTKALVIDKNMLTNMLASVPATNSKSQRSMCSLTNSLHLPKAITARGAKGTGLFPWLV